MSHIYTLEYEHTWPMDCWPEAPGVPGFIQRCKRCGHEDERSHEDGVGPCRGYTQSYDASGIPCGCSITGCDCPGFVPQDEPPTRYQRTQEKEDHA